jgi:hypothetical protein
MLFMGDEPGWSDKDVTPHRGKTFKVIEFFGY